MRKTATEDMLREYIRTAFFAETVGNDDSPAPVDFMYDFNDLDLKSRSICLAEIQWFLDNALNILVDEAELNNESLQDSGISQAMHDLWLTRNGHGTGFWDGDYSLENGEALTLIAQKLGEACFFVDKSSGEPRISIEVSGSVLNENSISMSNH